MMIRLPIRIRNRSGRSLGRGLTGSWLQGRSMKQIWTMTVLLGLVGLLGCETKAPGYGVERQLLLSSERTQVWAVAPAINLSGISDPDPLLQADLLYGQLQTVAGLKVIPVNRVLEVFA